MMRKHVKLASSTSINSFYAGELARPYVSAAILSGITLDSRSVRVLENVKYKANLNKVATAQIIQAATCDFTDEADVTLTERVLEPTELQVNLQLCKKDWVPHWESVNMGAGRLDHDIPTSLSGFILENIAAKVAESMEYQIWQGESAGGGAYTLFDGFLEVFKDAATSNIGNNLEGGASGATDANSTLISALSAAGDPTNPSHVIGIFENVLAEIPTAILQSSDFTVYANQKVLFALRRAQAALGFKDDFYERQGEFTSFLGYRVAPAYGLPDTTIVMGEQDNFVFGTDLLSDHIEANVIDMAQTDGSQNVRVVMRFTGGTQIAVIEDAYRYTYQA